VSARIATVFALVPQIYLAIKLAGAGYLLWPAWKAVRPGGRSAFATHELAQDGSGKLFLMGFLTCLLTPKVAILYISLLPQFVDPARGHVGFQGMLLGLTQIAVGVAGNAFFIVTTCCVLSPQPGATSCGIYWLPSCSRSRRRRRRREPP
jgi:threonine/homoserine/homoserine lactone efflux protein